MNRQNIPIFCLAYITGLLSTAFFGVRALFSSEVLSKPDWAGIFIIFAILTTLTAILIPRWWLTGPKPKVWLIAGLIAILAVVYFQLRVPQPGTNDISHKLVESENNSSIAVKVEGQILSEPKLTNKQKVRFWFKAENLTIRENNQQETVTGKLYVTAPLLQGNGLYPSQKVAVTGILYKPKTAANPGSFDFKSYLAGEGAFAGLSAFNVTFENDTTKPWGLWELRQRIIRAQVRWLGSPVGPLLSSIVLGSRAVDLPYDIRDLFIKSGLAHVLAASGFQVSLLIGVVLFLTRGFSEKTQIIIGLSTLIIYIGLTGVQPSVMRAGIMGIAGFIGLLAERKVQPLGSLLLAATVLLLFNPLWIWDLGFQLSFLATLGLIVTAPVIQEKLDFLPEAIASLIAVPFAATIWTLPLTSYVFNTVSIYSILVNIITTPLIIIISLGGMFSALVAIIFPLLGSAIAFLLYYPTLLLINIIQFFTKLPGSYLAVGKISLEILIIIYGLICLVWLSKWWQNRWLFVGLFAITLLIVPIFYQQLKLVQITVLADKSQVLVIQDRGKVTLINHGDSDTARSTILPFLAHQGINQIDLTVSYGFQSTNLSEIKGSVPIKREKQLLNIDENLSIGSTDIKLVNTQPFVLKLEFLEQIWLLLNDETLKEKEMKITETADVLLFSGKSVSKEWLEKIKPKVAIAISSSLDENTQKLLQEKQIELYLTGRDGGIQWTPKKGFKTTLDGDGDSFLS